MAKFIDLSGRKFGRLLVQEISHKAKRPSGTHVTYWKCICDCGNTTNVVGQDIRNGHTQSCGCLNTEALLASVVTHGMTGSRQYDIWKNIKARCNKDVSGNYGDRGIYYSPSWETFEGFWAEMGEGYADNLEIDRIDVNGGYSKENCRWVDGAVQNFNRRILKINTSGRTGVSFHRPSGKWHARIGYQKKLINLGCFDLYEDAVSAREAGELQYYGIIKEN